MTTEVRKALAQLARRRHGVNSWTPTARVGLLGWTEGNARALGVAPSPHPPTSAVQAGEIGSSWATWTILSMSLEDQLALLERTLARVLGDKVPARPVGYLLAARSAAPTLPDQTMLGSDTDRTSVGALAADLEREAQKIAKAETSPSYPLIDAAWAAFLYIVVRRFGA